MMTIKSLGERVLLLEQKIRKLSIRKRRAVRKKARELVRPRVCEQVSKIKRTVAAYYGIQPEVMDSEFRPEHIAWPRQVAMHICREALVDVGLVELGLCFGGRDHGTVIWAIKKVKNRMETEKQAMVDVARLMESCSMAITPPAQSSPGNPPTA